MSESFADLLDESIASLEMQPGSIVSGVVLDIDKNWVTVHVGLKSEGVISIDEFRTNDGQLNIEVGDQIEVALEAVEDGYGETRISREKARKISTWKNLEHALETGEFVTGKILNRVKGGFAVEVDVVKAFLPGSLVDTRPLKEAPNIENTIQDFKVIKLDYKRNNVVLSRKAVLEEANSAEKLELLKNLEEGQIVKGIVKNITDYGAFIDLDGLDGLLHITDMSWGRVSHPSEMVKTGEEITVCIIDIDEKRERVSLGLKQLSSNPWDEIENKFPINAKVRGKVVNLVPYGAFVELEEGVEGLVHITEMSWTKRITKPGEVLNVGDEVDAVVLGIQKDDQKISLGLRQLEVNPWDMATHNYPSGARVRGKIRNLTSYGAFVELEEGIDGMVHVSDMSWTRKINHPSEMVKKGDEVDAIVIEVDIDNQRISLGMKQLNQDPWDDIDRLYKLGDVIKGKVARVAGYGAFIELENEIDGLVHISQISEERIEKVKDHLDEGQTVSARVIKIDKEERRIGLSIKAANYDEDALAKEVAAYDEVGDDLTTSLGDLLDEATASNEE